MVEWQQFAGLVLIPAGKLARPECLSLTEGTVKNYVSAILAKTGLGDRTQAALYAIRQGIA